MNLGWPAQDPAGLDAEGIMIASLNLSQPQLPCLYNKAGGGGGVPIGPLIEIK